MRRGAAPRAALRAALRRRRGVRRRLTARALCARAAALAALAGHARGPSRRPPQHLAATRGLRSAAEARLRRVARRGRSPPASAALALALLLAQRGQDEAAAAVLRPLRFRWRLARSVLRYRRGGQGPGASTSDGTGASRGEGEARIVRSADGALPPWCLARLAEALAPASRFWAAHGYDPAGGRPPAPFFSYVHELPRAGELPQAGEGEGDGMDAVVRCVWRAAARVWPAVRGATRAEWWAHCRPHGAGHQLHFDSDAEGNTEGGPRHPIASAVVCLSPKGVGGPTLVTDQTSGDTTPAASGWLVHPRYGRLTVFDGRFLHGVVPGRGAPPGGAAARRITFMLAFWPDIETRPGEAPGAARPPPVRGLDVPPPTKAERGAGGQRRGRAVRPARVAPVWETLAGAPAEGLLPSYDECFVGC